MFKIFFSFFNKSSLFFLYFIFFLFFIVFISTCDQSFFDCFVSHLVFFTVFFIFPPILLTIHHWTFLVVLFFSIVCTFQNFSHLVIFFHHEILKKSFFAHFFRFFRVFSFVSNPIVNCLSILCHHWLMFFIVFVVFFCCFTVSVNASFVIFYVFVTKTHVGFILPFFLFSILFYLKIF